MPWRDIKLVPRSDDEPKFNPKNKTDRKIVTIIIILIIGLSILAGLLFFLYYSLMK